MHSRNSVPDILFSDNYRPKLRALQSAVWEFRENRPRKGKI